jgi:hypothetical protein
VTFNTAKFSSNPKLHNRLVDIIEPDYGLLDMLLSLDVLTRREFEDVTTMATANMRNQCLLEVLSKKSPELHERLPLALKNVGQLHVVNYLQCGGDNELVDTKDAGQLPLSDESVLKLTREFPRLVDEIYADDFLMTNLLAVGCINRQQRQVLEATMNAADKNRKLLMMLMRRSEADYQKFLEVLDKANMKHLVESLQCANRECVEYS